MDFTLRKRKEPAPFGTGSHKSCLPRPKWPLFGVGAITGLKSAEALAKADRPACNCPYNFDFCLLVFDLPIGLPSA